MRWVFNVGQRTAVIGAFKLAGYQGDLRVLPVDDETERIFVLPDDAVRALRHKETLEQIVQQILGRKVWIVAHTDGLPAPIAFE